jgi:hypothetical protein
MYLKTKTEKYQMISIQTIVLFGLIFDEFRRGVDAFTPNCKSIQRSVYASPIRDCHNTAVNDRSDSSCKQKSGEIFREMFRMQKLLVFNKKLHFSQNTTKTCAIGYNTPLDMHLNKH